MLDDPIYRDFGRAVAARRRSAKMTQEQVALAIGLSRASLANIERGNQKVFLHQILALTDALGLQSSHEIVPSKAFQRGRPARAATNLSGAKDLSRGQKELASRVADAWNRVEEFRK